MPTFLVTSKMEPALAARVEASVRGQRVVARAVRHRYLLSVARLGLALALVGLVAIIITARKRSAEQLETSRAALHAAFLAQFRTLTESERHLGARMAALIAPHTVLDYAGDSIAVPLKAEAGLSEALTGGAIYVRGPLSGFSNAANLNRSASESAKDAFLLCLLDPPDSHTEQALRKKARAVNVGGKGSAALASVERLFPLLAVTPLLRPEWERALLSADSQTELDRLERLFRKSPNESAVRAAKAKRLLLVLDEPGDGPGPTELDGERAHQVRVALIDLKTERVELRLRRRVDPSWLSAPVRAEFARGIDSCSLALDVRAALGAKSESVGAALARNAPR
ncbi:MAG TPA: hypothetical protein VG937_23455 [Polyangiaceae bacterium]|jgi:hypothetical protein|nr:hypothetical protein [Polyangiaceae bacterium]